MTFAAVPAEVTVGDFDRSGDAPSMTILREEASRGWWDRDIVEMLDHGRAMTLPAGEPASRIPVGGR